MITAIYVDIIRALHSGSIIGSIKSDRANLCSHCRNPKNWCKLIIKKKLSTLIFFFFFNPG